MISSRPALNLQTSSSSCSGSSGLQRKRSWLPQSLNLPNINHTSHTPAHHSFTNKSPPQSNMTASLEPQAVLSPLPKADGSATYSYAGYTITASANGPIEAQRKDENPYEAVVDVLVRPASGVGGESAQSFATGS